MSRAESRPNIDGERSASINGHLAISPAITRPPPVHNRDHDHDLSDAEYDLDAKIQLSAEQQHRKEFLQCVLLEVGILFHSVFIGMNLSVSAGKEFIILWIAISFHRKCSLSVTMQTKEECTLI